MIQTNSKIITGQESTADVSSSLGVLSEFYKAFNSYDYELMASNWLNSGDASMSNPLGDIKRGWTQIKKVYEIIFSGPAKVYVEFYDYKIFSGENFFQAVGREQGHLRIANDIIDLRIRTSRTFIINGGRYKQLHHHGSIEDPELLASYQTALCKAKVI